MLSDNVEVFEIAGQKVRLTLDDAALVVYVDSKRRGLSVLIDPLYKGHDSLHEAKFTNRTVGSETVCAAIFPRIDLTYLQGKKTKQDLYEFYIPGFYNPQYTDEEYSREDTTYKNTVSLYAGNVAEIDLRGQ